MKFPVVYSIVVNDEAFLHVIRQGLIIPEEIDCVRIAIGYDRDCLSYTACILERDVGNVVWYVPFVLQGLFVVVYFAITIIFDVSERCEFVFMRTVDDDSVVEESGICKFEMDFRVDIMVILQGAVLKT